MKSAPFFSLMSLFLFIYLCQTLIVSAEDSDYCSVGDNPPCEVPTDYANVTFHPLKSAFKGTPQYASAGGDHLTVYGVENNVLMYKPWSPDDFQHWPMEWEHLHVGQGDEISLVSFLLPPPPPAEDASETSTTSSEDIPTVDILRVDADGTLVLLRHVLEEELQKTSLGPAPTKFRAESLVIQLDAPSGSDDVAVVKRDDSGRIFIKKRITGVWDEWYDLGGEDFEGLQAVKSAGGLIFVFARSSCGAIMHIRFDEASGWSEWLALPYFCKESPTIIPFYRGYAIGFRHAQTLHTWLAIYHAWNEKFNNHDLGKIGDSAPALASATPLYIDVFIRDGSQVKRRTWIRHWRNDKWNGLWVPEWSGIPNSNISKGVPGAVGRDSEYDIFTSGEKGDLWHARFLPWPCSDCEQGVTDH